MPPSSQARAARAPPQRLAALRRRPAALHRCRPAHQQDATSAPRASAPCSRALLLPPRTPATAERTAVAGSGMRGQGTGERREGPDLAPLSPDLATAPPPHSRPTAAFRVPGRAPCPTPGRRSPSPAAARRAAHTRARAGRLPPHSRSCRLPPAVLTPASSRCPAGSVRR